MIRKISILSTASYIYSAQKPIIELFLQYCLISVDYALLSATSELVMINFSCILLVTKNVYYSQFAMWSITKSISGSSCALDGADQRGEIV
jgi:hypothetical protein